jgi:hypothetical protein
MSNVFSYDSNSSSIEEMPIASVIGMICKDGVPDVIRTDGGSEFKNHQVYAGLKELKKAGFDVPDFPPVDFVPSTLAVHLFDSLDCEPHDLAKRYQSN